MRVAVFQDFYTKIPLTTFAPNVILSGLAARHKLRCFEAPVAHHHRKTGQCSIKKWKLLKAALKSFWQTAAFAMKGGSPFSKKRDLAMFCGTMSDEEFAEFNAATEETRQK